MQWRGSVKAVSLEKTVLKEQWEKIGIKDHHGIALPLFALHTEKSCGIGEFLDLLPLLTWCKDVGFDVIQLLPLNDTGQDTSPYSAISANALNPLHISLLDLPSASDEPSLKIQIQNLKKLNQTQTVNYLGVRLGKERFFREYYHKYGHATTSLKDYADFKAKHAFWLPSFALFKALKVWNNWQNWETWPEDQQRAASELYQSEALKAEMEYHIFLQYHAFRQLEQVKQKASELNILLKGDIPILINRDSADVWAFRKLFLLGFAAGAPPDMYAKEGQKWGFPLYNWGELAASNYQWWTERLKVASSLYHLYRIDHIVGFFRIWAIPVDRPAKEGHFIPEDKALWIPQGTAIMEMMCKACDMLPIGEDLGTVPNEVRATLKSLGICGTKVMRWERRWEEDKGFIDPKDYIPESMTCVSTHDSTPLALWWENEQEESKLFAKAMGFDYAPKLSPDTRLQILRASHQSGSLFHINLLPEYVALIPELTWGSLSDDRINHPGTISDSNWTYRFRISCEELTSNAPLGALCKSLL